MSENEWRNTDTYRAVIQAYRRERQMGDEYAAEDAGITAFLRFNPNVTEREARVTVRAMIDYALVNAPAWFWGTSSTGKDLVIPRGRRTRD